MLTMDKNKQINKAIDKLTALSGESNRYDAIGMLLASLGDGYKDVARLAYRYFEEHNYHSLCSVLNWTCDLYEFKHKDDLNNIKWLFANHLYTVKMALNGDGTWQEKKYKAKIEFEEVDDDGKSHGGLVTYVRECARNAGSDLSGKTDDEIIRFALSYLGANIEDAVISGLTQEKES